jgi:hypothetical protein
MESVIFSFQLLLGVLVAVGIAYVVFPPNFKPNDGRYRRNSERDEADDSFSRY